MIANTPKPPYYAVIFTSIRTEAETEEYGKMAQRMVELAAEQHGFFGAESARNEVGITVSYWQTEADILAWKRHAEHQVAQEFGRKKWYEAYQTRVCLVERDYGFSKATKP